MEEDTEIYLQLRNLSAINSDRHLEDIISTLWRTRKTGLSASDKSYILSLINLPNLAQLHPVLVCLRSLIRKCTRDHFLVDELHNFFPPDMPLHLRTNLITVFQKYQNQWKEEIARDQHHLSSSDIPLQRIDPGLPLPSNSSPSSEIGASHRPLEAGTDASAHNNLGESTPSTSDVNVSHLRSMLLQRDVSKENLGTLPHLKSMTWTLTNRSKTPTSRAAVISLKLQDYSKAPFGETEVKFQLTRETFEAMLKSMTYINEQLSR